MDLAEIQRYLSASRGHSVCVHVCEVPEAPGYLRTVMIHDDLAVTIEYDDCKTYVEQDCEGGGLKYVGKYDTLSKLVEDLELWLGLPVDRWTNHTAEPFSPAHLDNAEPEANQKFFEDLVRSNSVSLPSGRYEIAGIYWQQIARHGDYSLERAFEEQEEEFRQMFGDKGDEVPEDPEDEGPGS